MKYVLEEELGNKILAYLVERPYKEVSHLIIPLMTIKQFQEVTPTIQEGGDSNVPSSGPQSQESIQPQEANQESNGEKQETISEG